MSTLPPSPSAVASIAAGITKKYGHLQCEQCANELESAFKKAGIHGDVLELTAVAAWNHNWIFMRDEGFSFPFPMRSGVKYIAENGRHFGVAINGVVFDNIFRTGIKQADWELQFTCSTDNIKCAIKRRF